MIAYSHVSFDSYKGRRATLAVEIPSKEYFKKVLDTYSNLGMVRLGYAICLPEDQFVKKIGREIAKKNLNWHHVRFEGIRVEGTKHIYSFTVVQFDKTGREIDYILLSFSLTNESTHVKLIQARMVNFKCALKR